METPRYVLIRFHEIGLKGKNRPMFVNALVNNLRRATVGHGVQHIWSEHMLIRASLDPNADWHTVKNRLKTVPGAVKFSLAYRTDSNYSSIAHLVEQVADQLTFQSFRITAHRTDKRFNMRTKELNAKLGDLVRNKSGAKVDLKNPQVNLHVEIFATDTFVFHEQATGLGGLPVGTGGRVAVLMSGGIDSPVAAWRMIRRGCHATLIHFHSFPLVDGLSREKARELAETLNQYQQDTRLMLVPFADLQKQIILSVPGPLRVVAYRRFMFRIAKSIAMRERARALVTGESLGQVGSQTLQNISTIDNAIDGIPILRPLIGMDKQEIIEQARNIGTYSISIMPDEDCCTLFVPKSLSTAVQLSEIQKAEAQLDVYSLVASAVSQAELLEYHTP